MGVGAVLLAAAFIIAFFSFEASFSSESYREHGSSEFYREHGVSIGEGLQMFYGVNVGLLLFCFSAALAFYIISKL